MNVSSSKNLSDFYYKTPFNDNNASNNLVSIMPNYAGHYGNDSDGKLSEVYYQNQQYANIIPFYNFSNS